MIGKITRNEQFVNKDGTLTQRAYQFLSLIADIDPILGEGDPEGSVEAKQGRLFIRTNGSAGTVLYVKKDPDTSGDRTKGWVNVHV